jgi:1-acyl-sn-glycerol-3-phosphate acyltransferase
VHGVPPALCTARLAARLTLALFGVWLRCFAPDALRAHRGLVFINHLSFLDPILAEALTPVRLLSTAEVQRIPFIG